jgi:hypothetical protein
VSTGVSRLGVVSRTTSVSKGVVSVAVVFGDCMSVNPTPMATITARAIMYGIKFILK